MTTLNCHVSLLVPSHCLPKTLSTTLLSKSRTCRTRNLECMVSSGHETTSSTTTTIVRRSGNYKPPIWDYNHIQLLQSQYLEESYKKRVDELKREVKMLIDDEMVKDDRSQQFELVDVLQRLGLSYIFEHEIHNMLERIYKNIGNFWEDSGNDLYTAALAFRLFRQHHFNIPQEIFSKFMNETGNFEEGLSRDVKGILCLYEASYLSVQNEDILEKARDFATKHLQHFVSSDDHKDKRESNCDVEMIRHALELPFHWRMPRLEHRWFIDVYQNKHDHDKNNLLLELAKLDYNMVQAIHQEDLKHASMWWSEIGLAKDLSFARDRLLQSFVWSVGTRSEPEFSYGRQMSTKFTALITVIDDVYDVYGTLDELRLFTQALERWDVNSIEHLPEYMRTCFVVLDDTLNEMALKSQERLGMDVTSHLKSTWIELCKVYMLEAEWYHNGYTPSLQEYIDNACISISAPLVLVHAYLVTTKHATQQALSFLEPNNYHDIIRGCGTILRLADDLGTSSDEMKRGDVLKSIQCYMLETGCSEKEARKHIEHLIDATWNKVNKDRVVADCPFPRDFIKTVLNLARMSQFMYQHGDGHGSEDEVMMSRIKSLLIRPIPL